MSLERPSAARRMILARMTSRYGDVYFRARSSSSARSSLDSSMMCGLCLGTIGASPVCTKPRKLNWKLMLSYVIVFTNSGTKEGSSPNLQAFGNSLQFWTLCCSAARVMVRKTISLLALALLSICASRSYATTVQRLGVDELVKIPHQIVVGRVAG